MTAPKRSEQLPNVPTFDEAGFKGFTAQVLYGVLAPAGTPPAIIEKLNVEVNRVLQSPEFKESVAKVGVEVRGGTPASFAAFRCRARKMVTRRAASGARVD